MDLGAGLVFARVELADGSSETAKLVIAAP
jgi:hypothetical protein